jgi:glycosyltransferase involved in cell wall biosynthesis
VRPTDGAFSIVCLSSQDWRVDLPTNRQQIMRRAAARGHDVIFVETGSFLGTHLWRLLRGPGRRSLAARLLATEEVRDGVRARKAVNLLPWRTKYSIANSANTRLTAAALRRLVRSLPQPVVLWIYDPIAAGLIGRCGEIFPVYDCVDDYPEQAGDGRRRTLVTAGDRFAAQRSRIVFATTTSLYERQRDRNPNTHIVPNVGDFEHFRPAAERAAAAPDAADLRRPVIGFAGNLTIAKVDFGLLESLARTHPGWTMLLVGPARRDARTPLDRLLKLSNVRWLGPKPYESLPAYVAGFDIALIPYVSNEYTRSCFPLKLYEYLAAGKPVVASGLPELRGLEPDVVVADGQDEFRQAVDSALQADSETDRKRRMALAAANTWETRTSRLLELIAEELTTPEPMARASSASVAPQR